MRSYLRTTGDTLRVHDTSGVIWVRRAVQVIFSKFGMEKEKYDRQGLKEALESHLSELQNELARLQNEFAKQQNKLYGGSIGD